MQFQKIMNYNWKVGVIVVGLSSNSYIYAKRGSNLTVLVHSLGVFELLTVTSMYKRGRYSKSACTKFVHGLGKMRESFWPNSIRMRCFMMPSKEAIEDVSWQEPFAFVSFRSLEPENCQVPIKLGNKYAESLRTRGKWNSVFMTLLL